MKTYIKMVCIAFVALLLVVTIGHTQEGWCTWGSTTEDCITSTGPCLPDSCDYGCPGYTDPACPVDIDKSKCTSGDAPGHCKAYDNWQELKVYGYLEGTENCPDSCGTIYLMATFRYNCQTVGGDSCPG